MCQNKKTKKQETQQVKTNFSNQSLNSPSIDYVSFLLTNDQKIIIQNKLPKCYSLVEPPKTKERINKINNRLIEESLSFKALKSKKSYPRFEQYQKEKKMKNRPAEQTEIIKQNKPQEQVQSDLIQHKDQQHFNNTTEAQNCKNKNIRNQQNNEFLTQQHLIFEKSLSTNDLIKKQLSKNQIQFLEEKQFMNEQTKIFGQQKRSFNELTVIKFKNEIQILKKLKNHRLVCPFLLPVDEIKDYAPNYYKIIKQPIDLQTIESKIYDQIYKDPIQFHIDIQKMLMNSRQYNRQNSCMIKITNQVQKIYQKITQIIQRNNQEQSIQIKNVKQVKNKLSANFNDNKSVSKNQKGNYHENGIKKKQQKPANKRKRKYF